MRTIRIAGAALLAAMAAACVPRAGAARARRPRRRPAGPAAAARARAAAAARRLDGCAAEPRRLALPAGRGDARSPASSPDAAEPSRSAATQADRLIALAGRRAGALLTIRTTYGERRLPAIAGPPRTRCWRRFPPAIPCSIKWPSAAGRFLVQAEGGPALIVPAWPEIARVDRGLPRPIKKAPFRAPREAWNPSQKKFEIKT